MEQAIRLFSSLILTFLGFVAPIVGFLLSVFREGALKLTTQYENEKSQSEENLKQQLKKEAGAKETNLRDIKESIKKLELIKKTARKKLSYLNPRNQIGGLFLWLFSSFLAASLSLLIVDNSYNPSLFINKDVFYVCLLAAGICFTRSLFILWNLLEIIIEVRKIMDDDKKTADNDKKNIDNRTIELLSALVEKTGMVLHDFLKKVYITVQNIKIQDDTTEIELDVNKKIELKISVVNSETRMAKNVEIGFIFTPDFIIDKKDDFSLFTDEKGQIVRYSIPLIHGDTNSLRPALVVTPLKTGSFAIRTFIKAENIEATYHILRLKVK